CARDFYGGYYPWFFVVW
nr:immunoglobulin heavy chain junction region [Mus musculus]